MVRAVVRQMMSYRIATHSLFGLKPCSTGIVITEKVRLKLRNYNQILRRRPAARKVCCFPAQVDIESWSCSSLPRSGDCRCPESWRFFHCRIWSSRPVLPGAAVLADARSPPWLKVECRKEAAGVLGDYEPEHAAWPGASKLAALRRRAAQQQIQRWKRHGC